MGHGADPIFGLPRPLIFAHRGGAGEVPESTREAFRHAIDVGADVLELDLQLTRDGEIVVWHGPGLGACHTGTTRWREEYEISDYYWSQLRHLYVEHPEQGDMATQPERRLITLEEFADFLEDIEAKLPVAADGSPPRHALNIELKKTSRPAPDWDDDLAGRAPLWQPLFTQLDRLRGNGQRKVLVASMSSRIMKAFRREDTSDRRKGNPPYPTNVTPLKQAAYWRLLLPPVVRFALGARRLLFGWRWSKGVQAVAGLAMLRRLLRLGPQENLEGKAFETHYAAAPARLVARVHREKGGVYVFLTKFGPVGALDTQIDEEARRKIRNILDAGVDGLMTDYPRLLAGELRAMGRRP